jgi:hypothetical protein
MNRGNMPPSSRCKPLAVYFEVIPISSDRALGRTQGQATRRGKLRVKEATSLDRTLFNAI